MQKITAKFCGTVFVFLLTITPIQAKLEDTKQIQNALANNQKNLEKIQQLTRQLEKDYDQHEQELKTTEEAISNNQQQLQNIQRQQSQLSQQIAELQQQAQTLQQERANQQQQLADQIKHLYQSGANHSAKQWLNQQNPEKLQRLNIYHQYIQQARLKQLQAHQQTLIDLEQNQQQLQATEQQLELNNRVIAEQQQQLSQQRQERQALLIQVQQEQQQSKLSTQQLLRKQSDLQTLLTQIMQTRQASKDKENALKQSRQREADSANSNRLNSAAPDSKSEKTLAYFDSGLPSENQVASNLKGQLPWPARGKLRAAFGDRHDQYDLTWKGIFIDAPEGNKVRAVHNGEIIFANWLRGYGLLCIIDHGNGILSLYGHNKSLTRTLGEKVKTNDIIGEIGNSGGQQHSGLYFEIRQQGKASDPLLWLKKS